jgi:hypothetical protein
MHKPALDVPAVQSVKPKLWKARRGRRARAVGAGSLMIALLGLLTLLTAVVTSSGQTPPPRRPDRGERPPRGEPRQRRSPPGSNAAQPQSNPATTAPTTGPATRPVPHPVPIDPNALTDEKIGLSIRKGADWLYKQIDPKTHTVTKAAAASAAGDGDKSTEGGLDALVVYALVQSGLALRDDKRFDIKGDEVHAMLDALCKYDMVGRHATYAHGLRATALSLIIDERGDDRSIPKDEAQKIAAYRQVLEGDALWLLSACDGGGYNYDRPKGAPRTPEAIAEFYNRITPENLPGRKERVDNSNSQYGVLGVWSAAEVGFEVPLAYWGIVEHYWRTCQHKDGQWDYGGDERQAKLSMTCAGLASLLVTHDYLDPAIMSGKVARAPFSPAVAQGLTWFEEGDHSVGPQADDGYTLYGVERVGLASGFKHFGTHDWYKELAARAIKGQNAKEGHWGSVVNTAYHLLFLARGRHPIVMSKLRFDGDNAAPPYWSNRPRDAMNLAKYAGRAVERPLNWQVVHSSTTEWTEWTDAPILSLASQAAPKLSPEEIDKIRNFVYAGGMLFTQADGDSPEFDRFANKLCKDLFNGELAPLPRDHVLLTPETLYKIQPPIPLKYYGNGARIFMLHSPRDVTKWWQQRDEKRHKAEFELGINMFVYAAGKRDLRNRIDPAWVSAPTAPPVATTQVVRLEYAGTSGSWDPEPGAWRRYANWFQRQTSFKLDVANVKLSELKRGDAPVAVLTGTFKQAWTPAEAAALKAYVEAGGVVLADATGGSGAFDATVTDLLRAAFPGTRLEPIAPTHAMLAGKIVGTEDLGKRRLRTTTIQRLGRTGGLLQVLSAGKGHVIVSPLDVTSGLLGTDTGGILGYEPAYAQSLVKNVIFWTQDGQKDRAAAPTAAPATLPAATAARATAPEPPAKK